MTDSDVESLGGSRPPTPRPTVATPPPYSRAGVSNPLPALPRSSLRGRSSDRDGVAVAGAERSSSAGTIASKTASKMKEVFSRSRSQSKDRKAKPSKARPASTHSMRTRSASRASSRASSTASTRDARVSKLTKASDTHVGESVPSAPQLETKRYFHPSDPPAAVADDGDHDTNSVRSLDPLEKKAVVAGGKGKVPLENIEGFQDLLRPNVAFQQMNLRPSRYDKYDLQQATDAAREIATPEHSQAAWTAHAVKHAEKRPFELPKPIQRVVLLKDNRTSDVSKKLPQIRAQLRKDYTKRFSTNFTNFDTFLNEFCEIVNSFNMRDEDAHSFLLSFLQGKFAQQTAMSLATPSVGLVRTLENWRKYLCKQNTIETFLEEIRVWRIPKDVPIEPALFELFSTVRMAYPRCTETEREEHFRRKLMEVVPDKIKSELKYKNEQKYMQVEKPLSLSEIVELAARYNLGAGSIDKPESAKYYNRGGLRTLQVHQTETGHNGDCVQVCQIDADQDGQKPVMQHDQSPKWDSQGVANGGFVPSRNAAMPRQDNRGFRQNQFAPSPQFMTRNFGRGNNGGTGAQSFSNQAWPLDMNDQQQFGPSTFQPRQNNRQYADFRPGNWQQSQAPRHDNNMRSRPRGYSRPPQAQPHQNMQNPNLGPPMRNHTFLYGHEQDFRKAQRMVPRNSLDSPIQEQSDKPLPYRLDKGKIIPHHENQLSPYPSHLATFIATRDGKFSITRRLKNHMMGRCSACGFANDHMAASDRCPYKRDGDSFVLCTECKCGMHQKCLLAPNIAARLKSLADAASQQLN